MKRKEMVLDCGVTVYLFNNGSMGEVSLIDMYNGNPYGALSDFKKVAQLFMELDFLGYKPNGMIRTEGYYGDTDDITLDFIKK